LEESSFRTSWELRRLQLLTDCKYDTTKTPQLLACPDSDLVSPQPSSSPQVRSFDSLIRFFTMTKRRLESALNPTPKRQQTLHELLPSAPLPIPRSPTYVPPPPPAPTSDSASLTELKALSIETARVTWTRLKEGYEDKSGKGYPAAIRTPNGCLSCQKVPNRQVSQLSCYHIKNLLTLRQQNGYVQIAPVVEVRTRVRSGEPRKAKPLPQNGHRLAVIAWHSEESRRHLLDDGWHASHRCANPLCIEPSHIHVEPKSANEARKSCRDHVSIFCQYWSDRN
jgi:hypothetical protein